MAVEELPLRPDFEVATPPEVAALLEDADERIREWFSRREDRSVSGFVPSDYPSAWRALCAVADLGLDPGLFLEWGSGFGVVTAMASILGHEAHGIEIDSDLAERARDLVDEHAPDASIHFGSYFPNGFDAVEDDDEFLSVLPGPAAYDDVGHEVRDFDVVYVFPWPGTESMHLELFDRTASPGAILVSHQGLEGTHVLRKTDGVPSLDDFA